MKSLLSRVTGLPCGLGVASRGRRLLAQGMLRQVHISEEERPDCQQLQKTRSSSHSNTPRTRARTSSQSTTLSSTTGSTSSSYRSTSSSTTRLKDSTTKYSIRSDSSATSRPYAPFDDRSQEKAPFLPHTGSAPPPRSLQFRSGTSVNAKNPEPGSEWSNIYALIFTDFIILAQPVVNKAQPSQSPKRFETHERWNTLDAFGVFLVLGIADHSGQYGE